MANWEMCSSFSSCYIFVTMLTFKKKTSSYMYLNRYTSQAGATNSYNNFPGCSFCPNLVLPPFTSFVLPSYLLLQWASFPWFELYLFINKKNSHWGSGKTVQIAAGALEIINSRNIKILMGSQTNFIFSNKYIDLGISNSSAKLTVLQRL